jgi:endonuclease/exonuclease/phosphatase family metal-dependent hydrolase
MRIAVYNQMFGLNGKSFFGNLYGHYLVHYQSNPEKVLEKANLNNTIREVRNSKADIIGICELYEGQEKEIMRKLRKLGYRFFFFGKGHKFKYNSRHVVEVIASKIKGKQLKFNEWPVENHLGGGGGFVVCKFPKIKTNIFLVHLGFPTKKYYFEQIKHAQDILKDLKGKNILMGDFNEEYYKIRVHFSNLDLITNNIKTCSFTPILKWFCHKDMDHIMVKGFKKIKTGTFQGFSDHKLLYADLK